MINIRIHCFSIILIMLCLSSCDKRYNFKLYRNSNGSKDIYIKGNITNDLIPEGKFIFYNDLGKREAKGKYVNGIKQGIWKYRMNKDEITMSWEEYDNGTIRFPYLKDWKQENMESFLVNKIKWTKDSTIKSAFRARIFSLEEEGFNNFNDYDNAYRSDMRIKNRIYQSYDYTYELKENFPKVENISLFQYNGKDKQGNTFIIFFFLKGIENSKQVLELHYIVPDNEKQNYHIFSEIIIDLYYKNKLVFEERWGNIK